MVLEKMKDNIVLWTCKLCGYDWRGKSPKVRSMRPHCYQCGSWSVKVKDWLIDKEKWEKARLDALERSVWRCQACGQKLNLSAPVHHLDYDDYYHPDNLICLCPHCHFLIHGKSPSYIRGKISMIFGMILIILGVLGINEVKISQTPIAQTPLVLAFIGVPLGIGLILLAFRLTKETRKVQKSAKKVIKKRQKLQAAILVKSELTMSQINGIFYCQQCMREISEQEFEDFGGLCKQCRGMPFQKEFPSPPGFPKP